MLLFLFRVFFAAIWIAFSCLVGITVSLFRPFNPKNVKVSSDLIKWGRFILGIEIEAVGEEYLLAQSPCIYLSNHQDNLDIFPGSFLLPKNTVTIGKRSIIFIPFFGLYFWLTGNILINRKNKKSAFETMDYAANKIKQNKISVWIMPEGTRSKGRGVLPFKKGPFITAIKAQVPVVPIAISSYVSHINLKKWKAGKILIEVLPPISTEGLDIDDVNKLKDKTHHLISSTVNKLDAQLEIL